RLDNLSELSTLENQTEKNSSDCKKNPTEAAFVHGLGPQRSVVRGLQPLWGLSAWLTEEPPACPPDTLRRNWTIFDRTSSQESDTTTFSPLTRVKTVSGAFSTNLMRSGFTNNV